MGLAATGVGNLEPGTMQIAGLQLPAGIESPRLGDLESTLRSVRRDPSSYAREADLLIRGLGPPAAEPVLEVGPGVGLYLFELCSRGYAVHGVDTVRENVDLLTKVSRAWAPSVEVTHGDVTRLEQADDSFAGVYGVHVWEHVHDQRAALHEAARVLRPGGRLVIIDGNFFNPMHWKEFFIDRARNRKDPLAGFKWLANKRKVVDDFGMGWRGKDEDLKSVWWWRREIAAVPRLSPRAITTTHDFRRREAGRGGLGPLAPFAGRIVVVAEKMA